MIHNTNEGSISNALIPRYLQYHAIKVCEGRDDLPLRVMVGRVDGSTLLVKKLLDYQAHVTTLGLVSAGFHRHEAALLAASAGAGAFQGSLEQFDAWCKKTKIKYEAMLQTSLHDNTQWVIWHRPKLKRLILFPL